MLQKEFAIKALAAATLGSARAFIELPAEKEKKQPTRKHTRASEDFTFH